VPFCVSLILISVIQCSKGGLLPLLLTIRLSTPLTATMAASNAGTWNAEAGVWVGDRAIGGDIAVPKPLVIFGYGSLCWRPDTTLEAFESFPCLIRGWTRLFAQRSTDHRGTPEFPGLVATICEVSALESLPGFDAASTADSTLGRAYVVPDDEATKVLAELDFREKGGCVSWRGTLRTTFPPILTPCRFE